MSPIRIREPTPPFFGSTASAICSLLIAPSSRIANIAVLAQRDLCTAGREGLCWRARGARLPEAVKATEIGDED